MKLYQDGYATLYEGHVLDVLEILPDESVDCVMTSPPYWGLRAYHTEPQIWGGDPDCVHGWQSATLPARSGSMTGYKNNGGTPSTDKSASHHSQASAFCFKCNAWKGELGLEPDFNLYIDHLIMVFSEVKRVLKKTGTCWVNIADSYAGSWGNYGSRAGGQRPQTVDKFARPGATPETFIPGTVNCGVPPKSLIGIPERFALAMTDRLGFIRRNNIVWWKRNPMPESCKDRFTDDWEPVYFFSKSQRYYFEQQFEPAQDWGTRDRSQYRNGTDDPKLKQHGLDNCNASETGRNARTVWDIPAQAAVVRGTHYASYPEKLCLLPIKAGCPSAICTKCGKAREKIYKTENMVIKRSDWGAAAGNRTASSGTMIEPAKREEIGLTDCGCSAPFTPGVVLDPFSGTATTLCVAKSLGRKSIGIELLPKYNKVAIPRLERVDVPMELQI
jgi:site-specific DNA-methyltransferase (adenine-specific)